MARRPHARTKRKKEKSESYMDYNLIFIIAFLLVFGIVMIYSASSYEAMQKYGDPSYFLKKQIMAVGLGLVAMFVVSRIPYHFWRRFAVPGYIFSTLLIFVVLTPLGIESHHARRWIRVPGLGQLQPAEICKVAMILFMASLVCSLGKKITYLRAMCWIALFAVVPFVLLWKVTDNMSSALIVFLIAAIMYFVASPDYAKFVAIGAGAVIALTGLVMFIVRLDSTTDFRFRRVQVWLHPENDSQVTGFQTLQGLYAIGSGGVLGKGLGRSMQKLSFLPEAQNDMIFSIICEELGLFGAIAVILLFVMLIWRMVIIASNASDLFGAMLVVGVIAHIAVQAVLNIAVVTNTIPNTGISLPFISYGGTSVMFLLIEVGLVLSVANGIELKDY